MKRIRYLFLLIILIFKTGEIYAQWSTDPSNNLIVGYGLLPELCSDSAEGCYITYEENLTYTRHLILERLNRYGYKPWGTGKRILGEYSEQCGAKIVEDGQNGVIIAYLDAQEAGMYSRITRLHVQRVDSSGNFLWGADGLRVSLSETNQYDEEIASDGNNGCFVAWYDTTNILRLQRINNLGQRVLGDSGIYVDASNSNDVQIVSDELGGCILFVGDANGARYHHIDSNGTKLWGRNGISADSSAGSVMCSDGHGGIITAGVRGISYNNGDPYYSARCQRIDSTGNILWGTSGVIVEDSIQNIINFLHAPPLSIAENVSGGITISWSKRIDSNKLSSYLQRIKNDGTPVFTDSIVRVSSIDSSSNSPVKIISSEHDSKIILFVDSRSNGSIYIQKFDSIGIRYWNNDVLISDWQIDNLNAVTDGKGGIIVVGFGQANFSIQALQCNRDGVVGEVITGVQDKKREDQYKFLLYQNYPNPFNLSTIIRYDLFQNVHVYISVYNLLGQEVKVLADGFEFSGEHQVLFDAGCFPSGIYYYRLITDRIIQTNKLTILK